MTVCDPILNGPVESSASVTLSPLSGSNEPASTSLGEMLAVQEAFAVTVVSLVVTTGGLFSEESRTAITNEPSELTLALTVLVSKLGASEVGEKVVRSTNTPFSLWRIRSLANKAGSVAVGTLKVTVYGPDTTASVWILKAMKEESGITNP